MMDTPRGERFQDDADRYAAYLKTPEGRLRLDLVFANLREFIAEPGHSLRALDVGCGTGAMAVRLALLGIDVTLMDSSTAMLDLARSAVREAGVTGKTTVKLGDAARLADLLPGGSFDIVLCHNLLEYVDDPDAVLRGMARMMRDSSAALSILVRNQAGEVLKTAIKTGDLAASRNALRAEWGQESLYGGKVRLFTGDSMQAMLNKMSLTIVAGRGVRVIADYLPPQLSREAEYERILELEGELGRRPEFAPIARYSHSLVRRGRPATGEGA